MWFDIAVHDFERVQMSEARRDLAHGALGIEGDSELAELVRPLNDVCKRGRAQLESDVEETRVRLLVIISNNVRMVVCILEEADFAVREGNKVSKESFDGHCTALQGARIDNSAMRTVT